MALRETEDSLRERKEYSNLIKKIHDKSTEEKNITDFSCRLRLFIPVKYFASENSYKCVLVFRVKII